MELPTKFIDTPVAPAVSERWYRALFEAAPVGMLLVDEFRVVQLANKAAEQMFRYGAEGVVGKEVEQLIPERFRKEHLSYQAGYWQTRATRSMGEGRSILAVDKNGREFPVEVALSVLQEGDRSYVITIIEDISKRKAIEKELQRSNEDLAEFAHVASHDLQEPIRMIGLYSSLLSEQYGSLLDDHGKKCLYFLSEGSRRMQEMIRAILAYSMVGRESEVSESTDSNMALDAAKENLHLAIQQANAEIVSADLPVISVPMMSMIQIFQNLIENALKFKKETEPPRIVIESRPLGQMQLFMVRDNGVGIEQEHFQRIFLLFQRLHTGQTHQGLGLGLATCKKLVQKYGGAIWVESEPGVGSVFFFSLPK